MSEPGQETAAEILAMAEEVMARARADTGGLWPRAAALLARQALERALHECWWGHGLALDACAMRPQLICIHWYMNRETAGSLHEAWALLTRACHHDGHEVAPTSAELLAATAAVRFASGPGDGA